jgi:hypothetical protein
MTTGCGLLSCYDRVVITGALRTICKCGEDEAVSVPGGFCTFDYSTFAGRCVFASGPSGGQLRPGTGQEVDLRDILPRHNLRSVGELFAAARPEAEKHWRFRPLR